MSIQTNTIRETFDTLAQDRQLDIIYSGTIMRLNDLKQRHFLAQSKVNMYRAQHQTTLAQLDAHGLPDDASPEMHENYIMWHHWAAVVDETQREIEHLQPLAEQGFPIRELKRVSI